MKVDLLKHKNYSYTNHGILITTLVVHIFKIWEDCLILGEPLSKPQNPRFGTQVDFSCLNYDRNVTILVALVFQFFGSILDLINTNFNTLVCTRKPVYSWLLSMNVPIIIKSFASISDACLLDI